ncbi:MAG: dienelactone hydrolase family protein [Opitutales bacterium]|nr:dienelactone hydrolase family protein [Opitutales bacterium]
MKSTLHSGRPLAEARGAVILLHGRGSSGQDIMGLGTAFPADGIAWFAPSAARGTWYPHRFLRPVEENEPWLGEALSTVDQLVEEALQAGLPSERIGLIGFSQGACLALEYAYRHPRRLAFVGGLSGGLIGPMETARPPVDLLKTPVLLGCAETDAHVPFAHVEHSARVLKESGADVTLQKYPGTAHTVFPDELEWLGQRIRRIGGGIRDE